MFFGESRDNGLTENFHTLDVPIFGNACQADTAYMAESRFPGLWDRSDVVPLFIAFDEVTVRIREAIELCLEEQGAPGDSLEFLGIQRITVAA